MFAIFPRARELRTEVPGFRAKYISREGSLKKMVKISWTATYFSQTKAAQSTEKYPLGLWFLLVYFVFVFMVFFRLY